MRRILLVDPESQGWDDLKRAVHSQYQWEVARAPTADAALALLEAASFDTIISSLHLPGTDGPTLLAQVRLRYPEVVRIVLCSPGESSAALRAVPVAHQSLTYPCDAAMLRVAVERACHLKTLLTDESIRRAVGALGDLPALPRVYQALREVLDDPNVSTSSVARIVEQDMAISAKILQLVNSAFFSLAQPITSIPNAVSYLGIDTIKNVTLSASVFEAFAPRACVSGFSLEALQQHAQWTARIAAQLPVPKHLSEAAVIGGLLHDVGKLVLACKLPERYAAVRRSVEVTGHSTHEVEADLFGYTHAEIGAYLLGLWGLPYAIAEAVAHHHAPARVPHHRFDAVAAVYVANILAHEKEENRSGPSPGAAESLDAQYLHDLGVQASLPAWRAVVAAAQ